MQLAENTHSLDSHSSLDSNLDIHPRITELNTQGKDNHPDTTKTIKTILRTVRSFDPFEWALSVQSLSPCQDLDQRTWIASAYQAAICLYAMRVLPSRHHHQPSEFSETDPEPENSGLEADSDEDQEREHLVSTIATQLSKLDPDSGLFKSSIWPSFIAGAEAKRPEHRRWAWMHLAAVSKVLPYKTSTYGMDVLAMIWRGDEQRHPGGGRGWMEMTRSLGADIFVA